MPESIDISFGAKKCFGAKKKLWSQKTMHKESSGSNWKNFQTTDFNVPNKIFLMKHALKLVPALADVGVPHCAEDREFYL